METETLLYVSPPSHYPVADYFPTPLRFTPYMCSGFAALSLMRSPGSYNVSFLLFLNAETSIPSQLVQAPKGRDVLKYLEQMEYFRPMTCHYQLLH